MTHHLQEKIRSKAISLHHAWLLPPAGRREVRLCRPQMRKWASTGNLWRMASWQLHGDLEPEPEPQSLWRTSIWGAWGRRLEVARLPWRSAVAPRRCRKRVKKALRWESMKRSCANWLYLRLSGFNLKVMEFNSMVLNGVVEPGVKSDGEAINTQASLLDASTNLKSTKIEGKRS